MKELFESKLRIIKSTVDSFTQCLLPVGIYRPQKLNMEFHRICKSHLLFHISLFGCSFSKTNPDMTLLFQLILVRGHNCLILSGQARTQKTSEILDLKFRIQQQSSRKVLPSGDKVARQLEKCVRVVDTSWIYRLPLIYCTWHLISKTELLQRTKMLLVWKSPNSMMHSIFVVAPWKRWSNKPSRLRRRTVQSILYRIPSKSRAATHSQKQVY